ncbi:hypothetical protein QJS10_CPB14g00439 [Acorus calamus]|uniref:CRM domain-containing protein n=1 Tax=Acorus calamus TaxID=4465 RepID=A0AAV9DDG5_ACOCL|nr:hypothetical protein QJS10_CPB14g00439 [Acorus calamus]
MGREKKVRALTEAERRLPGELLGRLRREARGLGRWVKVRKAGVTEEVVEKIKEGWGEGELVMVRFGVPLCRNMDRAREIVEGGVGWNDRVEMTGGLVVWSKKDALVIYRGCNYHNASVPSGISWESEEDNHVSTVKSNAIINRATITENQEESPFVAGTALEINNDTLPINETLYEREANRLLDGLGPRYTNWWWPKPLPVDGDMLPEVVPGFRPPFRRCPPHLRPKLTDDELTYLRKLARPLPTHFVLGRNSKLQGLAAAIIKVWEKCSIVKIALKYGIPNTNNEMMAWELKASAFHNCVVPHLNNLIGKDFLPGRVANLIFKREKELDSCQLQEEDARLKAFRSLHNMDNNNDTLPSASMGEACSEFQYIQTKLGDVGEYEFDPKVQIEAEKERLEKEIRKQERRLSILQMKLERSENELAKLNSSWKPGEKVADQELITEEERQTFRRIGLKMDQFLLLGRRGVYDGVIGSIHQHWKHREVVKVITMQRDYSQIIQTARLLENESGGLLVAVEKLKRGHAIIIYRGKNYSRPLKFLPENLLTKREALQQSMEMQRRGSLKFFARLTAQIISDLKDRLGNLEGRNEEMMSGTSENQK